MEEGGGGRMMSMSDEPLHGADMKKGHSNGV